MAQKNKQNSVEYTLVTAAFTCLYCTFTAARIFIHSFLIIQHIPLGALISSTEGREGFIYITVGQEIKHGLGRWFIFAV